MKRFHLLAAIALALSGCSLVADDEPAAAVPTWVEAWQAAPSGALPDTCSGGGRPSAFPQYSARAQTLRYAIRPSISGNATRVRLSNRFGTTPLIVAHVTVARTSTGAAVVPGTTRDALFSGLRSATVPAGEELTSDDVPLAVEGDKPITVSIALASGGPLTWHPTGPENAYATRAGMGDRTLETRGTSFTARLRSSVVLAGVEVRSRVKAGAIVAIGDSLTDGGVGTATTNWVEVLGKRLRGSDRPRSVANAGITCNALLHGNDTIGPRASERFADDVLNRAGVSHVIILLGTNDLHSGAASDDVIAALAELAQRARAKGIRVIGGTIIPENGSSRPRNAARVAVNRWIRTADVFDGVIDFDAAIRSTSNPAAMNPRYRGDNVHPNARGQVAMGNVIDLDLFR